MRADPRREPPGGICSGICTARYGRRVSLTEPQSPLERWSLDPAIHHLDHGAYGGCPRAVTAAATAWRARLEAAPVTFMVLDWQTELDRARDALAAFLHAPVDRLVFVPSATGGVAIALASVELAAGDEIVTTDHAYRACKNQLDRLAAARGAHIRVVATPLPFDAGALVDAVARALAPRTRLALFDHITSASALRLPLEPLLALTAARGIPTVVDGAHAPGQITLDVGALLAAGATYYTGNCHKWMCAAKGTGFLAIAPGAAARPVVTSHGASPEYGPANRLHAELDWPGTHDPSAHLSVPTAITAIAGEGGGWPAVIARNHALACELRRRLIDALARPGAPRSASLLAPDDAIGCMATVPVELPPGLAPADLQLRLLRDGWEVPSFAPPGGPVVRVSAHLYNYAGQAEQVAEKLRALGVALRAAASS